MHFDWHDSKSDECLAERGFDFAYASQLFDGETVRFVDDREDYGETRIIAFGHIGGRMYAVVYTDRDDVRWIISAFPCRPKELKRGQRRATAAR